MDSIRLAGPADAHALAVIHVEGWRAAYQHIVPWELMEERTIEAREADFAQLLDHPAGDDRAWVVERESQVIALAYTRAGLDHDIAAPGELKLFYVLPWLRGNGVGLPLFEHAVADLISRGLEPYLYTFRENVAARAWYERRGWRPDGAEAPWSPDGRYPGLIEVRYRPSR